jgi:hypothetical protein
MNACLDEDALLRFLNGDHDADEDPRVVAHIEDCNECQGRLERLTRVLLAPGGASTLEMAIHDPGPNGEPSKQAGKARGIEVEATKKAEAPA